MSDLIRRADALSCFSDWVDSKGDVHSADEMPEYQRIEELPSAEPTICGYDIEHLRLIAEVLRRERLSPERVAEVILDVGKIFEIAHDEFEQMLRKAVEQCMI